MQARQTRLVLAVATVLGASSALADRGQKLLPGPAQQKLLPGSRTSSATVNTRSGSFNKRALDRQVRKDFALHKRSYRAFKAAYESSAQFLDRKGMQQALQHRASMARHKVGAWKNQVKIYDYLATQARARGELEQAGRYDGKVKVLRRGIARTEKLLPKWEKAIPQLADERLARLVNKAGPEAAAAVPTTSFRDNSKQFNASIRRNDMVAAGEALLAMQQQAKGAGNRLVRGWRQGLVALKQRQLFRADSKLDRAMLDDQINGRMSAHTINKLLKKMDRATREGNTLTRAYKRWQHRGLTRKVRKAVEKRMVEATTDGSIYLMTNHQTGEIYSRDADLLRLVSDRRALRAELRASFDHYLQQNYQINIQQGSAEWRAALKDPEFRSFVRHARRDFTTQAREQLRGSNLIEGIRVLDHLDRRARHSYATDKGVRRWANEQVHRFSSWVLGSPLRSHRRASAALLKQADRLNRTKDVNSHMQAAALLLTAEAIQPRNSRKFKQVRKSSIKRLKNVIQQAVKGGDPDAVVQAYDLYTAYHMDSQLREWKGPKEQLGGYKRDRVAAERKLVDMLTRQAEWILLHPKKAARMGYSEQEAIRMNAMAERRAEVASSLIPGAIDKNQRRRISGNNKLIGGKSRLRKLVHSNYNPVNWPLGVAKYIVTQPIYLFKRGPSSPKTPANPQRLYQLMQKYEGQAANAGMGGGGGVGMSQEAADQYQRLLEQQAAMMQQ